MSESKNSNQSHRLPGGGRGTLQERLARQIIMRQKMSYVEPRRVNYKGIAIMDRIRERKGQPE